MKNHYPVCGIINQEAVLASANLFVAVHEGYRRKRGALDGVSWV